MIPTNTRMLTVSRVLILRARAMNENQDRPTRSSRQLSVPGDPAASPIDVVRRNWREVEPLSSAPRTAQARTSAGSPLLLSVALISGLHRPLSPQLHSTNAVRIAERDGYSVTRPNIFSSPHRYKSPVATTPPNASSIPKMTASNKCSRPSILGCRRSVAAPLCSKPTWTLAPSRSANRIQGNSNL